MTNGPASVLALKRILWVDDEYDEGVARLLRFDGIAVDCAPTVAKGFAMASASTYDAIVLDQRLPDGSGLQLLEMLRDGCIHSPVLVLTGFGNIESAVNALRLGAVDYREKPLIGDEWVESIRRLVELGARRPYTDNPEASRTPPHTTVVMVLSALRQYDESSRPGGVVELLVEAMSSCELSDSDFVACAEACRGAVTAVARGAAASTVAAEAARLLTEFALGSDLGRHPTVVEALVRIRGVLARGERPSLARLAAAAAWSADDVNRVLVLGTGRTFSQWRSLLAVKAACVELGSSSEQVAQIAYALGYEHVAQFNREFQRLLSVTPTEFRRLLTTRVV
jgi:ActR/RegA family two-component response regulator/AraC-like DNA-binding protein